MTQHVARQVALCLFSGLSGRNAGGVQESGRIAWHAVAEHADSQGASASLLVYGEADDTDLLLGGGPSVAAQTRWEVLRQTVLHQWDTPLICFWHLDLLQLLPLLRSREKEVVVFLHGIEAWRPQSWLIRRQLKRVDRFLSNSQYTWDRFCEFQPEVAARPHTVIPLGIGTPISHPPSLPEDPPTALMLGRLQRGEDYKGHREVIETWRRVQEGLPGARLWIAGDGDLRPELEALAVRRGVADTIQFWGRVSEQQKQELLCRSRCLALPSRGEGFGLVYLEAMRLGRPCLVSTNDAGREVVAPPQAGLAVDVQRPEELAAALLKLLSDGPDWQRHSENARRRYENGFTAEQFQQRLVVALFRPSSPTGL